MKFQFFKNTSHIPGKHWLKQYAAETSDTLYLDGTIIEITTENFSLLKLAYRKTFLGIFLAQVRDQNKGKFFDGT